jgi:hypothetical protein
MTRMTRITADLLGFSSEMIRVIRVLLMRYLLRTPIAELYPQLIIDPGAGL